MLSRRLFFKITASVLASVPFINESRAMSSLFFNPKDKSAPRLAENVFTDERGRALVGVSGKEGVDEKVKEAVGLVGGFRRLDLKGKTVLVKPNVVSGEPSPSTTSPEVVGAVVRALYGEGASNVIVGDMSAFATLSTKRNMRSNGIKAAAEENGAEVAVFEDHGWVEVKLPGTRFVDKAYVTEWLFDVDAVVNLPVVKTHRSATYSITLKNFIGCTHLRQRPYLIDSSHWEEIVAEFNAAYAPEINIVDATTSMIAGGPWSGTPADTGVIIASGDRVAADVVGLGIIKSFGEWGMVTRKDVWDQLQISTAIDLGVGRSRDGVSLVAGSGDDGFASLIKDIERHTGLEARVSG